MDRRLFLASSAETLRGYLTTGNARQVLVLDVDVDPQLDGLLVTYRRHDSERQRCWRRQLPVNSYPETPEAAQHFAADTFDMFLEAMAEVVDERRGGQPQGSVG